MKYKLSILGAFLNVRTISCNVNQKDDGTSAISDYQTPYNGGIIVPERITSTLYILKVGSSETERDWNNPVNILWQMPLKNALGVAPEDTLIYNQLWKRHLILSGEDGILRFDTESHEWAILQRAGRNDKDEPKGLYRGCEGLSYNSNTEEIIIGKSNDKIYSFGDTLSVRQMDNSQIYKARWWLHNSFSYAE